LFSFIPLMGTFHLWKAIAEGGEGSKIARYTFAQMISYFLTLILLDSLVSPTEDDFRIADNIREGLINQFLLKLIGRWLTLSIIPGSGATHGGSYFYRDDGELASYGDLIRDPSIVDRQERSVWDDFKGMNLFIDGNVAEEFHEELCAFHK
jgi:hypothetical protein